MRLSVEIRFSLRFDSECCSMHVGCLGMHMETRVGHTMSSSSSRQHLSLSENQAILARLAGQQAPCPQSYSMDMNNHACSLCRCSELELGPSCFQGKHSHPLSHHPGLVCPLFVFFFSLSSYLPFLPPFLLVLFLLNTTSSYLMVFLL